MKHLIARLASRNYHIGTIKEMVRIPAMNTPQTETDRYTQAGAEKSLPFQDGLTNVQELANLIEKA